MSGPRAQLGPRYSGDMGLGLCLACLGEIMVEQRPTPRFAVTLAPMLWPLGARDGVPVAVPACWDHVQAAAESSLRLVAANGRWPRQ